MFQMSFVNVPAPSKQFATLEDAIAAGRQAGFEFIVQDAANRIVASWSVFGGLRLS